MRSNAEHAAAAALMGSPFQRLLASLWYCCSQFLRVQLLHMEDRF